MVTQTDIYIYANICIYNSLDFIQPWNLRACHTSHFCSICRSHSDMCLTDAPKALSTVKDVRSVTVCRSVPCFIGSTLNNMTLLEWKNQRLFF